MRAIASQLHHHSGITDFAAALTAEVTRTPGYELLDLLPTSRSSAGYWYMGTNYVVHPDASFQLGYRGQWRPYFLEYERRATTPKRVPAKLESYRRLLPERMGSTIVDVDSASIVSIQVITAH